MNISNNRIVNELCDKAQENLLFWNMKCNTLSKICNQIGAFKKTNMEHFKLKEDVQKDIFESLEMRILEELMLLSQGISKLEDNLEKLEERRNILRDTCNEMICSSGDSIHEISIQSLLILDGLCADLAMIVPMKKIALRRATLQDLDSFNSFKEVNDKTSSIEAHFDRIYKKWKDIVK